MHMNSIKTKVAASLCAGYPSTEKITSPSAFQTILNRCVAINVHSKIDIKEQNIMKERQNGG